MARSWRLGGTPRKGGCVDSPQAVANMIFRIWNRAAKRYMLADHYATLGLAPQAAHSAIRAAYLALMQRYHPDKNHSADAGVRAREITVAYEVLGNRERRSDYDLERAEANSALVGQISISPGSKGAKFALFAFVALTFSMLLLLVPSAPEVDERRGQKSAVRSPQAAPHRQLNPAARQEPAAVVPVPSPADTSNQTDEVQDPAPAEVARVAEPSTLAASPPALSGRARAASRPTRASSTCANRSSGAAIVCKTPALVHLDRSLGVLFRQSVQQADAPKQRSLYSDHYRFIARLNRCTSKRCVRDEYLARMREISITMSARPEPHGHSNQ